MIAVIPVRRGELPSGAEEAVAEAGGRALVLGEGARSGAALLCPGSNGHPGARDGDGPHGGAAGGAAGGPPGGSTGGAPGGAADADGQLSVRYAELEGFRPGAWADALAGLLSGEDAVVLPASPDGRDLAPRLARSMGRPLFAGALAVSPRRVVLVRLGGKVTEELEVRAPFVATLLPGSRSVPAGNGSHALGTGIGAARVDLDPAGGPDAELVELVEADPAAVDLGEAPRIIAAGAGLTGEGAFDLLAEAGRRLGASVGATRVVTDAGLLAPERQIGTTGVSVRPRCYVALGISGAAQHVGGIGDPEHLVAVNLDASAPMMAMADLALVTDATALLEALVHRLRARGGHAAAGQMAAGHAAGGNAAGDNSGG